MTTYQINHPERLLSPSLVVFEDLVRANLAAALKMVGDPRLRLHVKTHKMRAIIAIQEAMGLHKHKVATIAEAEMTASAGGRDVLVAYPLVGSRPRPVRAARRGLSDHDFPAPGRRFRRHPRPRPRRCESRPAVPTLVDLDVGMGRTALHPAKPPRGSTS